MGFEMDASGLARSLGELDRRRLFAQETYAQTAAKQLESFARADAPWTDRSGLARGGISGKAKRSHSTITIMLSGSVRYLVYLELAHEKRWAVLWPTMQKHRARILNGFTKVEGL